MSASLPPDDPRQPRPGADKPSPPVQPTFPWWTWWLIMLSLLAWNAVSLLWPGPTPPLALSYSAFLDEVRAGHVASVTITGQNVEGAFNQPVERLPETAATPGPIGGDATPAPKPGASTTYVRFTTVLPPFPDNQLLPLLEQQGVTVSVKDANAGSWLVGLLGSLLPMLLFVGVLVMMGRQAQRGTQSLFGFGGSKARVYSRDKPGVTFADVAGEEQAKAELQEIVSFLKQPE